MGLTADLGGKRALVTGASSGFGRRFATVLAASGAHVTIAARRAALLEDLVGGIRESGAAADAIVLDVADGEAVEAALGACAPFDIVVNNAGVASETRALETSAEEWRRVYGVNVDGVFHVSRTCAAAMVKAGRGGSIINVSSITATRPAAGSAAYSSSKAAVAQLTSALAQEWARHGVRVNAIAPGFFETDLNRAFLASDFGATMMKRIPQRRFGLEGELDGALLLLASDASAYMTGSVIVVDGGHLVSVL